MASAWVEASWLVLDSRLFDERLPVKFGFYIGAH